MIDFRKISKAKRGFTIIELMVATVVFSVVLLIVTYGVIQVSRTYYKGITETDTQNTARSVIDTIARAIQFSNSTQAAAGAAPGTSYDFCVGNQQFNYRLGWKVVDGAPDVSNHETPHGLYVYPSVAGCDGAAAADLSTIGRTGGRELLSPNMRLAKLSVTQVAGSVNLYKVTVRVVFGDDDLIESPSDASAAGPTRSDARCKSLRSGTEFCASSELSTVVEKRVE